MCLLISFLYKIGSKKSIVEKIGWVSIKTLHWISIIQCSNLLKVERVWGQISRTYNVVNEKVLILLCFGLKYENVIPPYSQQKF